MITVGAVFLPQFPPEVLPAVARTAEESGLDELWLWEDSFLHGGISAAAAALGGTTRIGLGIGIMPVPFRNVAIAAMEIATLRRMFGDRAIIGFGHGVQEWMGQVGARPASPLTHLREYVAALRGLLAGEEVSVSGSYVTLDRVKLSWPPDAPTELYLGAQGPRTQDLAREIADGTILVGGTSPADVAAFREPLGEDQQHRIVVYVPTSFDEDAHRRLSARDFTHGSTGLGGSAEEVAAGALAWADAGATSIVFEPLSADGDPEAFVIQAAEVKRLLKAQLGFHKS